jgi:hypothetical protein
MHIDIPIYKWAKCYTVFDKMFFDVHMSEDGQRIATFTDEWRSIQKHLLIFNP